MLLANIIISLSFFFLFLVIFNNFIIISVTKENIKPKHAHAIPTEALIILVK